MFYDFDFNGGNLKIEKGSFVLVCGKSGSGKTMLLKQMHSQLQKEGINTGFVMQDVDAQIVTDKVWHELAFGLENNGISADTMHRRVGEVASYFGMNQWLDRDTQTLSGGQKQLLNLASVMVLNPQVLLLDEPASQLDPVAASNFFNTIKKINRDLGTTIVIVEHRLEDLFADSHKVILLDKMCICAQGSPEELTGNINIQKSELVEFLPAVSRIAIACGQSDSIPVTISQGRRWLEEKCAETTWPDANRVRDHDVQARREFFSKTRQFDVCAESTWPDANRVRDRGGKTTAQRGLAARARPAGGDAQMILEIKNLGFRYGRKGPDILEGLNLELYRGEIFAITGANGSGKSTLMRLMCGLAKPVSGKICVDRKTRILMLSQNVRNVFAKRSVAQELEQVAMPLDHETLIDFDQNAHPYDLSGGEMQKLGLELLLRQRPDVVLLDEPTKGLDDIFKKQLSQTIRKMASKGISVVIVCHDLEFCACTADRVGMMFEGRLVSVQETKSFFAENNFYTTAANRMSRGILEDCVVEEDVTQFIRHGTEER